MTQDPFKWGPPQDATPIQDLQDLARFAAAKMTDDLNRADGRVDAMFRAFGIQPPRRSSWTVVSPATYANLLDIAEREGFPFDKPAVKVPRARGAVASWVLGRFVPVVPTSGYHLFLRGRDAPATEAGAIGLLDELRSR